MLSLMSGYYDFYMLLESYVVLSTVYKTILLHLFCLWVESFHHGMNKDEGCLKQSDECNLET